jgi:putative endonuclease
MREGLYYAYLMQSVSRNALYTGMSGFLRQRIWEHKTGAFEGFSLDYETHRLVHYEGFDKVHEAIAREKEIKG